MATNPRFKYNPKHFVVELLIGADTFAIDMGKCEDCANQCVNRLLGRLHVDSVDKIRIWHNGSAHATYRLKDRPSTSLATSVSPFRRLWAALKMLNEVNSRIGAAKAGSRELLDAKADLVDAEHEFQKIQEEMYGLGL